MKKFKLNGLLQFISGIVLVIVGMIALFNKKFTLDFVSYMAIYTLLAFGLVQIALIFKSDEKSKIAHLVV